MSTTTKTEVIRITFTEEDVYGMAADLGIAPDRALDRARSWASSIEDTATALVNEQLSSVIQHDAP